MHKRSSSTEQQALQHPAMELMRWRLRSELQRRSKSHETFVRAGETRLLNELVKATSFPTLDRDGPDTLRLSMD